MVLIKECRDVFPEETSNVRLSQYKQVIDIVPHMRKQVRWSIDFRALRLDAASGKIP